MDANELGRILQVRLNKVIHPGFHVRYGDDGVLLFTSDPGRFPGQNSDYIVGWAGVPLRDFFELYGQIVEERVLNACIKALDDLQDYIGEATHEPWPGDKTPPRPYAEIQETKVVFGYGTPSAPVLECDPIPLN